MCYELTDHEWAGIRPMLPNKPRGVPRVNDRSVLNGMGRSRGGLSSKEVRINLIERFFKKIKHCRRAVARSDKLAANYLAFVQLASVQLASIRLWLRADAFTA